jgi:hypothetical protein
VKLRLSRRTRRIVAIVLVVLAAALAGTGCATRAPSDQIVLYYKSGAGDNKVFHQCIQPSTSGDYPVDDEVFYLPTSLRTWNVVADGSGDSTEPVRSGSLAIQVTPEGLPLPTGYNGPVVTQAGAEVATYTGTDFYINTDCDGKADSPVVKFWENTGRRAWVDGKGIATNGEDGFQPDAWVKMLQNTLVLAQATVLNQVTRLFTADDLDVNANGVWSTMEKMIQTDFQTELRRKVGGNDYFCGADYRRGQEVEWTEWVRTSQTDAKGLPVFTEKRVKGKCPPVQVKILSINFANKDTADARARVYTAQQDALTNLIRARSELEKAQLLAQAGDVASAVRFRELEIAQRQADAQFKAAEACANNANCTVILGSTPNVTLPAR